MYYISMTPLRARVLIDSSKSWEDEDHSAVHIHTIVD